MIGWSLKIIEWFDDLRAGMRFRSPEKLGERRLFFGVVMRTPPARMPVPVLRASSARPQWRVLRQWFEHANFKILRPSAGMSPNAPAVQQ
jgi:hypothetical protein